MASLESSLLDSCTLGKLKKRAGTSDARLAASVPSFVPVPAVPFPSGPDYDRRRYHVHAAKDYPHMPCRGLEVREITFDAQQEGRPAGTNCRVEASTYPVVGSRA